LLVVLSPKMVYSMTEWPRMRAAAVSDGFDVVTWRLPTLPEQEWRDAVVKAQWPASDIASVAVAPKECGPWLGQPNHFPYSLVVERGHVHPSPIWGVLPDAAWVDSLQQRRRELKWVGKGAGQ
jgi:hypothetical protein